MWIVAGAETFDQRRRAREVDQITWQRDGGVEQLAEHLVGEHLLDSLARHRMLRGDGEQLLDERANGVRIGARLNDA